MALLASTRHVALLPPAGKDPSQQWKLNGRIKREYDKSVKGCVRQRLGRAALAVLGGHV